jgi:DNA-binding CsgD family transcriptional regulator
MMAINICLNTEIDNTCTDSSTDSLPRIIGEFFVDGHQCVILACLTNCTDYFDKDLSLSSCPVWQNPKEFVEVGRFKILGQSCLIMAAEEDTADADSDLAMVLTERELQIALLVALGQSNKLIAKHLHISEWTVATYLRRIFNKLGVESRAAMVYRCAPLIQRLRG